MIKRLLVALLLVPPLLAACSVAQPAETVEETPSVADPSVAPTSVVETGPEMECTLVSNGSNAPAELVAIFGVTEDDWVHGPETAAVTIVEYSDFQ